MDDKTLLHLFDSLSREVGAMKDSLSSEIAALRRDVKEGFDRIESRVARHGGSSTAEPAR